MKILIKARVIKNCPVSEVRAHGHPRSVHMVSLFSLSYCRLPLLLRCAICKGASGSAPRRAHYVLHQVRRPYKLYRHRHRDGSLFSTQYFPQHRGLRFPDCCVLVRKHYGNCQHMLLSDSWRTCVANAILGHIHRL